jgi:hypothetical protein
MSNPEGKMYKIAQTPEVAAANAKIDAIFAKHKQEKEKGERFKITPQMRREARIKALQDGDLDK